MICISLARKTLTLLGISMMASACCPAPVAGDSMDENGADSSNQQHLDFENVKAGEIPNGWIVAGTQQKGPLATWVVLEDATAPSQNHALALTQPNHHSRGTFNLCWNPQVKFLDGEITVRFKAHTGEVDQGGGILWRAQDANNYYIARYNPLEENFRIYTVIDGDRKRLASARAELVEGAWHQMKIIQTGDGYQAFLNDELLLEGTDSAFPDAGGVGLWTKADAVTTFDDFVVQ